MTLPLFTATRLLFAGALAVAPVFSIAADAGSAATFTPQQIEKGANLYAANCSGCHGAHMQDREPFDFKTLTPDQHDRFINSVTNGKEEMPPWKGQLSETDIANLWAYVQAGEKQ